jgi:hypothetical protein
MKYWEIIADNLSKPVGVGAVFQRLIPTGERSPVLLSVRTKLIATGAYNLRDLGVPTQA